jgi:predicted RNA binding protein YcfA (HicA-like mRNA interferase family)
MGKRAYPSLTPGQVVDILTALGFERRGQVGSHAQYFKAASKDRKAALVTVDMHYREFDDDLMHSMIRQSGFDRKTFYGCTKYSARRASVPFIVPSLG